jgi:N-acetylglucosaminyldiphosphoundecaprenol N-acetyl-beta-D-mannosaminyltransferase
MSRIRLLNCPFDALDLEQTMTVIVRFIEERHPRQHVVINVAKLVDMRKDLELRSIIESCDLINADGMPIVWASKLLGRPLPCRIAGVDLFQHLVRLCAEKGYRPFFFGAREWVVQKVIETLVTRYPELNIAGFRNGYFKSDEELEIASTIRDSNADILFVGFSSPTKEKFLKRWMSVMNVPFSMGVGGSFDIIAGRTKRAPEWMQRSGLEWFYRLLQEPERMWKRYLVTNILFALMVLGEILKGPNRRSEKP